MKTIQDSMQKREKKEKELISIIQQNKQFSHEFDDCGTLKGTPEKIISYIIGFENAGLSELDSANGNYSDSFFALHCNKELEQDIEPKIKELDSWLKDRGLSIRKGDIGFVSGKPYGILALATPEKAKTRPGIEIVGSIDSITEGKDFRTTQDYAHSGFYGCCAALSDIGANGAIPTKLHVLLINPNKKQEKFIKGINEAAEYCGVKELFPVQKINDKSLGEFCAVFTSIGEAPAGRQLNLKWLEEGMNIYVAGSIGISSAANYYIPKKHLMKNLNPAFRKNIFDSLHTGSLCNDVSDGFEKSARNILRNSNGLSIKIYLKELMGASKNDFVRKLSIENVLFGGDDYCLVIATHSKLEGNEVYKVGKVVSGEKEVYYS